MIARLKQIGIDIDVHRAIEQARLSFAESENDILRRVLLGEAVKRTPPMVQRPAKLSDDQTRSRGLWSVEVHGEREAAPNMKEAYKALLLKLDQISPNFMARFAAERSRARRFVARDPVELYDSSPHLAKEHAQPLKDGWYFDTNLSTEQVAARARVAAKVAGLNYGRDAKILENLRVI